MPASTSDARNKWKKQKRDPQISSSRKPKSQHHDDDDPLDEEEDDLDVDPNQQDFEDELHNSSDPVSAAAAETEVLSDGGVRLSNFPSVIKHTVNRSHSSVLSIVALERSCQRGEAASSRSQSHQNGLCLENISYGQLQSLSAVPADSPILTGGDDGAYVIKPEPIRKGNGVVKQWDANCTHVLPMHSDWFSPSSIDRIERQVVPHFFSGKSSNHTPKNYLECRNAIVGKYLENPEKRLLVSDCYGLIVGIDNADVNRIFRFLENWGIINYCAPPLIHESKNDGSCLCEDANGELCVPAAALKSIDSLIQFDKPRCLLKAEDVYPELVSRGHQTADWDSMIRVALNEIRCNHCSRPLAVVYYQSQKEMDARLCLECFNEGRFVIGHSSLDFVKFDATKVYGDQDGESWTDQETLSLLEGIEMFNDNFGQIAEHVGNKTKAQCVSHFMRLRVNEGLLENVGIPSPSRATSPNLISGEDRGRSESRLNGESAGSSEINDSETKIPFAKSGNPVMSQVAFLASAVGPRVAAASAHASLATLSIGDRAADLGKLGMINGSAPGNRMTSENRNATEGGPGAEELGAQGPLNQDDVDGSPLSSERVLKAARAGLSAAAMKAKLFADHEEREIQRLSANIINHQLKRLELKLKQFAEVETLLMKECEQVERARQRIAAERALMTSSPQFGPSGPTRTPELPGMGPSLANSNAGSSSRQQQVGPSSSSQQFMSGFSNNPPIHPHMPHQQQQQQQQQQQPIYGHGLGPRLPLNAINPSSSSGGAHPNLRPNSRQGFN